MLRRKIVVAVIALTLAGCTTAKNTLAIDDIATLRLAGVDVRFAPDASINWGDGERAFAASKGQPATESDTLARTPEGHAYLRSTVGAKVKAAMERSLSAALSGSRPVRVNVTVKIVLVVSVIQRVIVGGHHTMTADVTLTDAKTGAALLSYAAQTTSATAGQGIAGTIIEATLAADPIDRVVNNYAERYSDWLLHREPTIDPAASR